LEVSLFIFLLELQHDKVRYSDTSLSFASNYFISIYKTFCRCNDTWRPSYFLISNKKVLEALIGVYFIMLVPKIIKKIEELNETKNN